MTGRSKILSDYYRNIFGIVSAWHQGKLLGANEFSHEQLKTNLRNLGWGFIELRCNFLYLRDTEQAGEEKTLFIPEVNLYDLMMLGIKYEQKAFLYKDKTRFELLNTDIGRVLSSFSFAYSDNLKEAYSKYLEARSTTEIIVISLEEHRIPTLADSLQSRREQGLLAETTWIKIF
jgi:hypothetical protein